MKKTEKFNMYLVSMCIFRIKMQETNVYIYIERERDNRVKLNVFT